MALRLPMSGGFESFSNVRDIPFIARHASMSREEVCKRLKVPADKPIVLASFGGFGLSGLETDTLAKFKKYTVVTAVNLPLSRARKDTAIERKGSYISVNEEAMYDAGSALRGSRRRRRGRRHQARLRNHLRVHRQRFGDSVHGARPFSRVRRAVEEMPKYLRSAFINQDDLFTGKWESYLDKLRVAAEAKEKAGDQRRRRRRRHPAESARQTSEEAARAAARQG